MPEFNGALCRGARSLLGGWSIAELSNCSGVSVSTITAFEGERRKPIPSNHNVLLRTLQEHGVIFIDADANDGSGLRLTKTAEVVRDITGPLWPDESIGDRVNSAVERTEKFERKRPAKHTAPPWTHPLTFRRTFRSCGMRSGVKFLVGFVCGKMSA